MYKTPLYLTKEELKIVKDILHSYIDMINISDFVQYKYKSSVDKIEDISNRVEELIGMYDKGGVDSVE